MNVMTISASIKLSKQLPGQECWKTVELGAEANLETAQDWKVCQSQLYLQLAQQLKVLWGEAKVATPPVTAPPVRTPASAPAAPHPSPAAGPTCPDHGLARPSKRGGLYCPGVTADGAYCPWTFKPAKAKAANGRR